MQGIFAGGTDYSNQSIDAISKDIKSWSNLCENIKSQFELSINELTIDGYWLEKVPFDFRAYCANTIRTCETFINDFDFIVGAIDNDEVTKREIALLQNINKVAHQNEQESWKTFKNPDDGPWKQYGNNQFAKAEKLYQISRDFYVTLFDVDNAACRLEDYMKESTVINKSIHAENSVVIGDGNTIKRSTITAKEPTKKHWLLEHLWLPILVAVIAGLIIWIIT